MSRTLSLLACQIAVPEIRAPAARDRHLTATAERIAAQLEQAATDLVVLPELSGQEYSRAAFDCLDVLAEPLEGASFQIYRKLAKRFRVALVYGIARRSAEGYCITQVALGPDGGLLGAYDKIHLAQYGASIEKNYFQRGRKAFAFELKGVRIAPIICYDIRIPELTRTLVLQEDVELLLHCGAYARDESFDSWHDFVVTRALENQIYLLSLNRAGSAFGDSLFCGPWTDRSHPPFRFPQTEEAFLRLEVDCAEIAKVRARYSFLADRLPAYSVLT